MAASAPNAYLRTKVMTASPAELRLMLLEGAIRFLEQGRIGLEEQDHEKAFNGLTRCQDIVLELLNGLDPRHAPELCDKLSGLYTFMYTRLVRACVERDIAIAREVLDLLRYERETWSMLVDQLSQERGRSAASPEDPGAAPGASLSVQG